MCVRPACLLPPLARLLCRARRTCAAGCTAALPLRCVAPRPTLRPPAPAMRARSGQHERAAGQADGGGGERAPVPGHPHSGQQQRAERGGLPGEAERGVVQRGAAAPGRRRASPCVHSCWPLEGAAPASRSSCSFSAPWVPTSPLFPPPASPLCRTCGGSARRCTRRCKSMWSNRLRASCSWCRCGGAAVRGMLPRLGAAPGLCHCSQPSPDGARPSPWPRLTPLSPSPPPSQALYDLDSGAVDFFGLMGSGSGSS